jgi:hypothetical protein
MLNRGEYLNALKRSIYVGRVARTSYQAKQHEEMQAVADSLSLLANLADCPDAHRAHQFVRRIHLPNRAIPGLTTAVTFGTGRLF